MISEHDRLSAEVNHLKALLGDLEQEDWVGRKSLQRRLAQVEAELRRTSAVPTAPAAAVTFRGAPVEGSKGSEAKFTATALEKFTKLLGELANQTRARLVDAQSAPMPDFLLTGVATGSFGFVIEERNSTPETTVLQSAGDLLNASTDDDRFADALEDTDTQVLQSLTAFLTTLKAHGATVRVAGADWRAALDDDETLSAAIKRTQTAKDESEQRFRGTLVGLLPNDRRFEFRKHPSQEIVQGKFSAKTQRVKEAAFEAGFNKMGVATVRVRTFKRPWGDATRTSFELVDFEVE